MDRKTLIASGFTASVVLAFGAWKARLESWRPPAGPTYDDGATKPDEATECRVQLALDPELSVDEVRVGTSRWNAIYRSEALDYEIDQQRITARLDERGALRLFVESYGVGDSEWYEFEVTPGASRGDVLAGRSESRVHDDRVRPRHIDGVLTLSALPRRIGDPFAFDLRASVSTGWSFHAQAEVEVEAATVSSR